MGKVKYRRILALCCMLLSTMMAWAQNTDEAKAEALKIKKNVDYIYGEATGDTEEGLYDMAREVLVDRIKRFIASQPDMNGADGFIVENLQKKCKRITYTRGLKTYVMCVYVKKSDIQPLYRNQNSETDVDENVAQATEPAATEPIAAAQPTATVQTDTPVVQETPEVKEETSVQEVEKETVVPVAAESQMEPKQVETATSVVPVTTPPAVSTADLSTYSPKEQTVLGELLQQSNYEGVVSVLKTRKNKYHDVVYELVNGMSEKDCFWIVFDKQKNVIAVLNKNASFDIRANRAVDGRALYASYPKIWLLIL